MSITIAVDVMGGDNAPSSTLRGVHLASLKHADARFILFGPQDIINAFLNEHPHLRGACEIKHASERILGETSARDALRGLKDSSMRLAIESVRDGEADGVVSGGNTGAYMVLSKVLLKTIDGVDRPAITTTLPTQKGACVMLDLGANVEASATHLCQFAQMGEAFSRHVLGISAPSVGLLNIGSEDLKGHAVLKEAQELIRQTGAVSHFYGFVEGDDIMAGTTDVVVTDGFTGNVALKTMEGTFHFLMNAFKKNLGSSLLSKCGALLASGSLNAMKNQLDPRFHNGAPFLGLKGVAVKSHGGMDEIGFANALGVAITMVKFNLNDYLFDGAKRLQSLSAFQTPPLQTDTTPLD